MQCDSNPIAYGPYAMIVFLRCLRYSYVNAGLLTVAKVKEIEEGDHKIRILRKTTTIEEDSVKKCFRIGF